MNEFWVDISGSLKVRAETAEEAEEKMWEFFNKNIELTDGFSDVSLDVENVEEIKHYSV